MGLHGYTWFQAALSCLQYRGSLKTGLRSVASFQAVSSYYSQRQPENKVRHGAATMAYRPIHPPSPCQRTACQQAVRSADKRFRLPNICARVHAPIHFQAA